MPALEGHTTEALGDAGCKGRRNPRRSVEQLVLYVQISPMDCCIEFMVSTREIIFACFWFRLEKCSEVPGF